MCDWAEDEQKGGVRHMLRLAWGRAEGWVRSRVEWRVPTKRRAAAPLPRTAAATTTAACTLGRLPAPEVARHASRNTMQDPQVVQETAAQHTSSHAALPQTIVTQYRTSCSTATASTNTSSMLSPTWNQGAAALPRMSNTSMAPGAVPTAKKAPLGEAAVAVMGPSSLNTWLID
jgi:hypothetical protein